jgi:Sulfotransferase domain
MKIFCIGYMKTGTTSLGKSLESLGFIHTSFDRAVWDYYEQGEIPKVLEYMNQYDSADDLPWLKIEMIPILDEAFPGSIFIYLERDEESWLRSFMTWSLKKTGVEPDPIDAIRDYREHREFVLDYFEHSTDFISLNVAEPEAFNMLREFLGFPPSNEQFPVLNKTSDV